MFGNNPHEEKPSLLMRAGGVARGTSTDQSHAENIIPLSNNNDAATAHRLARASRRSAKPNPLLSALGRKAAMPEPQQKVIENSSSSEEYETRPQPSAQSVAPMYHQHPWPNDENIFKPLIDPAIMLGAVWRWRWPIAGLTILGGAVGVMAALNTPSYYTAYSKVLIDPRQVKLVERDLTPEFLGNEAALAIVDSQLETVVSTPALERVIERLNLDQNADFNGEADSGIGLFDGIAFVRSLFNSDTPVETAERTTLENLRSAVSAQRTARTFVFDISAKAKSPQLSAQIANAVTQSFIEMQAQRQTDAARNATSALGGQITVLKQAVERAEERAERFAQDNDLTRVEGLTVSDTQLVATSAQLTEAKAATIRAKSVATAAKDANVDQVVNGGLPPLLVTPGLTTFRAQFSSLSQNAASLEQALEPRHPRLANAIAAREAARDEIAAELARIKAGTQADLRAAIENEQEIASALARAKVQSGDSGDALIKLRELEAEIETARTLYKAALLRAGETTQLEELTNVNASIIAEAEPPLHPSSLSRKTIALTGALSGLLAGLGLAVISGLRQNFSAPTRGAPNTPAPTPTPTPTPTPSPSGTDTPRPVKRRETNVTNRHADEHPLTATSESTMYHVTPSHYPYAQNQSTQPQLMPQMQQPMQPMGYGQGYQPISQPQLPQPQMQMPYVPHMMVLPQQPYANYPQTAPMPYASQPMMQPQPMIPMPPHVQMQAPNPQFVYVQAPTMQTPYAQPMQQAPVYDQRAQLLQAQEEAEIEELRASVRDIRDVVDNLANRRSGNRNYR